MDFIMSDGGKPGQDFEGFAEGFGVNPVVSLSPQGAFASAALSGGQPPSAGMQFKR